MDPQDLMRARSSARSTAIEYPLKGNYKQFEMVHRIQKMLLHELQLTEFKCSKIETDEWQQFLIQTIRVYNNHGFLNVYSLVDDGLLSLEATLNEETGEKELHKFKQKKYISVDHNIIICFGQLNAKG